MTALGAAFETGFALPAGPRADLRCPVIGGTRVPVFGCGEPAARNELPTVEAAGVLAALDAAGSCGAGEESGVVGVGVEPPASGVEAGADAPELAPLEAPWGRDSARPERPREPRAAGDRPALARVGVRLGASVRALPWALVLREAR